MTDFGLFPEGLLVPTLDDLVAQFEGAVRAKFGLNFPLGDSTFAGFLIGSLSERLALLWDTLQQIDSSSDPDKATDLALRAIGLITGTVSPTPSPSTAVLTLCGDGGTVVPGGSVVRTPDTLRNFETDDSCNIQGLDPWTVAVTYDAGDRVTSSLRCYQAKAPGLSTVAPTTTDETIPDGPDLVWTYIGEGEGAGDVDSHSQDIGPVVALARGITDIQTPLTGWLSATNLLDARLGQGELSNEDFRTLRETELAAPGTGTVPALRADVLQLPGVITVRVFENFTDSTDGDGIPPHSFELLVQGGDDQQIFDTVRAGKPAGIRSHGNVTGSSVDEEGVSQPVAFSRPTEIEIWVDVTLVKDPQTYAGAPAVRGAISAYGNSQGIGVDAVAARLGSRAFVDGVIDVPRVGSLGGTLVGTAPSPTSDATVVVGTRQLATYAVARVTVNESDGVP